LSSLDECAIAVVGTRRPTSYGRDAADRLAGDLARAGVTIVSGLAKGIDTHAHRSALAACGRTIAVLGSGLDRIYPAENAALAREISEKGTLISEYPPGTPPDAANFPARNRIISGLSRGVLVIEARESSGALITADFALEQGRDVFAIPGNIFWPTSEGSHRLIQQGAKLVRCADDVLQELNLAQLPQQLEMRQVLPANDTEATLVQLLSDEPLHIDQVVRQSGLPTHVVSPALAMMELKGMVRQVGAMQYTLTKAPR
jgi:DNA processing protein